MFGWICLTFLINSALNGWLIRTPWIKSFYSVFQGRAAGSLILLTPCIVFFDSSHLSFRAEAIYYSVLMSLTLSIASWRFNKERKRPARESRNHAYLLNGAPGVTFYLLEVVSWIFYLIPYEYLMRGLLMTYLLTKFNTVTSIMLNCSLYALFHVQQGLRETQGAFLFGLLLCGVTVITGNFWSAFVIHLMFALSNSFIVMRNSEWVFIKKNYG